MPECSLLLVERAANSPPSPVENVGVDHRRRDIAVAQEFLDRPDVVTDVEEVRGERVAERMTGGKLGDAGQPCRVLERPLQDRFVSVMSPALAARLVKVHARRGEHPLPGPFQAGARIFALKGIRESDVPALPARS